MHLALWEFKNLLGNLEFSSEKDRIYLKYAFCFFSPALSHSGDSFWEWSLIDHFCKMEQSNISLPRS